MLLIISLLLCSTDWYHSATITNIFLTYNIYLIQLPIYVKNQAIMLVVSQYTVHLRAILVDKIMYLLHSYWFISYVLNITYVLNCVVFDADKLKAGVYQSSSSKHCFFQVSKNLKNKTLKVPWKFPSIRSWNNIQYLVLWANRVKMAYYIWAYITT